ncbi:MAG: hypothetical protein M0Z78_03480 [Betaproteobacteria bacterium]|nr:hypothetical protein [Betaproteobacteria bacterium]
MKTHWIICFTLAILSGCSAWQENAYNSAQIYNQLQCQKNPTADCPRGESYNAYQTQLKSEKSTSQP